MIISLAFIFLLTPTPSLQASVGERKNSTKPTPHAINLNVVSKPATSELNVKLKPQNLPTASKVSNVSQSSSSSTKPPANSNVQKASKDKPPATSTITVIISEGCIQKDMSNMTKIQEVELSVIPGSPLMMTHRISVEIGTCSGSCETEMEVLKGRVDFLEKEISALKKKCAPCTEEQCPNQCKGQGRCEGGKCVCQHGFSGPDCSDASCPSNCNNKGKCVNGKCVCQTGFTGLDCSKGPDKKSKFTVETLVMKESESDTDKQDTSAGKKTKAEKAIFEKKVEDEETKKGKKVEPTAKPSTNKSVSPTIIIKNQHEEAKNRKDGQIVIKEEKRQEHVTSGKKMVPKLEKENQIQTNVTTKVFTKQESAGKTSTKQEKLKDMPVNQNETQIIEKNSNRASVISTSLSKSPKANVTTGKGKLPQSSNVNSTESDKKIQVNITAVVKTEGSGRQIMEKHENGTISTERNKPQIHGSATVHKDGVPGQKKVDKHINATHSIEKDKKLHHVNATLLKDGASIRKKVEKHVNVSVPTEKDKNQLHANAIRPKEGLSENKKTDIHQNVTSSEKDKTFVHSNVTLVLKSGNRKQETHGNVTASNKDKKSPGNRTVTLKEVISANKKEDKHVKATSSTEQTKKLHHVDAILKEETSGKKKIEKHRNTTTTSEKHKRLQQGNETPALREATPTKKNVEKHSIVPSSSETDKIQLQGNETVSRESKKKVEKHINMTSNVEKDKKHLQVSSSLLKEETSGERKVEKHINVTMSHEKNKSNATLSKEGQKKMEKHANATSSTVAKDKKPIQVGVTIFKEEAHGKKKVNVVTVSDEKNKKQLQGNVTAGLGDKATGKKQLENHVNATASDSKEKTLRKVSETTALSEAKKKKAVSKIHIMIATEKDKLIQGNETMPLKERASGRRKVEKHVNVTVSTEKNRLPQVNATLIKETPGKKKMEATDEHDKKQLQGNKTTLLKESLKKKVEAGVSVTNSEAKTPKLKHIGSIEVHNITATGFIITWKAPQGMFRNFTVSRREVLTGGKDEEDAQTGKGEESDDKVNEPEIHSSNRTSKTHSGKADKKPTKKFSQVLSGTARSFHFRNLQPQTRYLVSLYCSRSGGPSKLHRLFVSTGPEPPTDLQFSNITETSMSVSWIKPKSIVTGFRVSYTNTANGETGSMSVDSQLSHVLISKLSAGSSYDISVKSVLEAIESEPTTASVVTVPDAPSDLQAVNITDTKALLTWKPSKAKVDNYILSYGYAKSPNVTVTVMLSGSSVEHQLRGLHRFTLYTVKIISQINNLPSRPVSTTFTTTSGVKLQAFTPTEVTFNSAMVSWKAPRLAFRSYRLTYQHKEDIKEVILNPSVTQYELTNLVAFSNYTVKIDGEIEGQYISVVSTAFTTAQAPYPYPTDCSQVQMNGMKESREAEVYPEGKDGEPVRVYCDMDTDGGGWTVFQRRVDGSTDFFRGWKDYSKGFGFLNAEFWLGNDILHSLTSLTPMTLRIDLHHGNDTAYAHYSNFSVGSEANHYTIAVSGYSGTAGDSMRYHNNRPFSTKDKDSDPLSINCAKAYMGGWWYKNCYRANLNGLYATFSENKGVVWIDWKGKDISIPFTEMKLRPTSSSHIPAQG